ncbi:MAG: hypothetical protein PVF83_08795, partial [Anaerolineales bacterium]
VRIPVGAQKSTHFLWVIFYVARERTSSFPFGKLQTNASVRLNPRGGTFKSAGRNLHYGGLFIS